MVEGVEGEQRQLELRQHSCVIAHTRSTCNIFVFAAAKEMQTVQSTGKREEGKV